MCTQITVRSPNVHRKERKSLLGYSIAWIIEKSNEFCVRFLPIRTCICGKLGDRVCNFEVIKYQKIWYWNLKLIVLLFYCFSILNLIVNLQVRNNEKIKIEKKFWTKKNRWSNFDLMRFMCRTFELFNKKNSKSAFFEFFWPQWSRDTNHMGSRWVDVNLTWFFSRTCNLLIKLVKITKKNLWGSRLSNTIESNVLTWKSSKVKKI